MTKQEREKLLDLYRDACKNTVDSIPQNKGFAEGFEQGINSALELAGISYYKRYTIWKSVQPEKYDERG